MAFYQMCQTQCDKMKQLTEGEARFLLVAGLSPEDDGEKKAVIEENLAMIGDLVTLGFMKDSTTDYVSSLDRILKVQTEDGLTKRPYRVYTVTELGNQMFGIPTKSIN